MDPVPPVPFPHPPSPADPGTARPPAAPGFWSRGRFLACGAALLGLSSGAFVWFQSANREDTPVSDAEIPPEIDYYVRERVARYRFVRRVGHGSRADVCLAAQQILVLYQGRPNSEGWRKWESVVRRECAPQPVS